MTANNYMPSFSLAPASMTPSAPAVPTAPVGPPVVADDLRAVSLAIGRLAARLPATPVSSERRGRAETALDRARAELGIAAAILGFVAGVTDEK